MFLNRHTALLLLLVLAPLATAQDQVPLDPPVVVQPPVDSSPAMTVFADSDVSAHQVKTLEEVKKVIRNSDNLRPLQKNRLLRRLNRSRVAQRVTDEITDRAMSAGYVTVSFDATTQEAVTQVDWNELIEFIERLIPLIVKLIGLF